MKLGQKVKCHGYIKKINGLKYIYANKKHFDRNNKDGLEIEPEFYLDDIDDDEFEQKTMETIMKDFVGYVVGVKAVSTSNFYMIATESEFDPVTFGYVGERLLDSVKVEKKNYVGCYHVFYGLRKVE